MHYCNILFFIIIETSFGLGIITEFPSQSVWFSSLKRFEAEMLSLMQTSQTVNTPTCCESPILRNFKNATFYVNCFLYWIDLMLFPIQYFILSRNNRKTNFALTVYSDVTTTLVIFNKTCISSGHLNQYETKQ